MKIEAGKFYKMRCGAVVGPMEENSDQNGLCIFECDEEQWYRSGKFYGGKATSPFDLIEEVPDPSLTSRIQEAKMAFDRAAFRRETAVKIVLSMVSNPTHLFDNDEFGPYAVEITDALLKELGE